MPETASLAAAPLLEAVHRLLRPNPETMRSNHGGFLAGAAASSGAQSGAA